MHDPNIFTAIETIRARRTHKKKERKKGKSELQENQCVSGMRKLAEQTKVFKGNKWNILNRSGPTKAKILSCNNNVTL